MRTDDDLAPSGAALAVAAALALLPACSIINRAGTGISGAGISFFTEPPGARILVDKKDSGFVTPNRLSLSRERHNVTLELSGYASVNLRVDRDLRIDTVLWRDMHVRSETWKFPLWLNMEDMLQPVKVNPTLSPGRVFVRLERASSAPPERPPSTQAERTSAALPSRAPVDPSQR